jgi:hypothetical protein
LFSDKISHGIEQSMLLVTSILHSIFILTWFEYIQTYSPALLSMAIYFVTLRRSYMKKEGGYDFGEDTN